jgi:carbon-monoxide dehydrogenase large subunit
VALRRLNLIAPEEIPYDAVSGETYDSGNFAAVLDKALDDSDWDGYAARQAASESTGKVRGRGIACYLEATAPAGKEMGGLRFNDGRVTIVTGTLAYGQGHETAFAQVLADRMGIDYDKIDLLQGDSVELLVGGGTGGSRSIMPPAQRSTKPPMRSSRKAPDWPPSRLRLRPQTSNGPMAVSVSLAPTGKSR